MNTSNVEQNQLADSDFFYEKGTEPRYKMSEPPKKSTLETPGFNNTLNE